jgi:hypothetical protein
VLGLNVEVKLSSFEYVTHFLTPSVVSERVLAFLVELTGNLGGELLGTFSLKSYSDLGGELILELHDRRNILVGVPLSVTIELERHPLKVRVVPIGG